MGRNCIINSEISKNGVIVHNTTSKDVKYLSRKVLGGIVWPINEKSIPGYFCIMGEEWIEQSRFEGYQDLRGKLRLLAEYVFEKYSLSDFCRRLGEDTARLCCTSIYATGEEDSAEQTRFFNQCISEQHIRGILEEAPFWKNPGIGIGNLEDWEKRSLLEIPDDTTLFDQMKHIQDIDIANMSEKFFAVRALCFVVGKFQIDGGSDLQPGYQPRRY